MRRAAVARPHRQAHPRLRHRPRPSFTRCSASSPGSSGSLFGTVSASPWARFAIGNLLLVFALAMFDIIPVSAPQRLMRWGGGSRRRIVPGGLPARGHVGGRRRTVRCSGIRGGAHVGRNHAQWGIGIRVPVRVFSRHDRAARRRRAVLRKRPPRFPPRRQLDGVGEEALRCGAARHGGVLLHSDGTSPVTRYGWLLTLALALPPALEAQEVGLAVGDPGARGHGRRSRRLSRWTWVAISASTP